MDKIRPVKGMNDILPDDTAAWHFIEATAMRVLESYGYREIRVPMLEHTALFTRSIGQASDIVSKEMYTFEDRGGESLTLRPEATAGVVRAGLTNNLLYNQRQRLWYIGPMFRRERPQAGRYRQFYQIGAEAFGYPGPDIDAELILLLARLWRELELDGLRLEVNSIGTPSSRAEYRERLVRYFGEHRDALDEDSLRRLEINPLRILDSKNPKLRDLIDGAPAVTDYLDAESAAHFDGFRRILDDAGLEYTVNPRLVRGLDYYTRTVFEWITDQLGAQGAVCAGGRYDGLVEELAGPPTPGVGFSLGVERVASLMKASGRDMPAERPDVYFVCFGAAARSSAIGLAERLRDRHPALDIEIDLSDSSAKSQMKAADRSGAQVAIIIGDDEIAERRVSVKPLRDPGAEQKTMSWNELLDELPDVLTAQPEGV